MNDEKKDTSKETAGKKTENKLDRRDFLQGLATAPVLGIFGYALAKEIGYQNAQKAAYEATKEVDPNLPELNVALIGYGGQGEVLLNAMLNIPKLRFRAVCDIWTEYSLRRVVNLLSRYDFEVNGYEDYREMLDTEKDLDAVVIASPDFWHARHTIDCLQAGLNVYCEKEMSNNLEDARQMVLTARETGKLLQIGHQRRSHPRYIHSYEKIIKEADMLGRIVTVNGQWNRSVQEDLTWSDRYAIPNSRLQKYGYGSMQQFRNWRWYKGLGGGPIVDLGSHQLDIYNWFLESRPKSLIASGSTDYYPKETHEWYDTVMVVLEYETERGPAKAYYQTQTTNGSLGYFENFMGIDGTLVISESEAANSGSVYRQPTATPWDEWVQKGYITAPKMQTISAESDALLDVRETMSPDEHEIPIVLRDPYHQPHLENFFNAIRGLEELNCPAEIGYETAVTVLKVNEAIEAGRRLTYNPGEFEV
ncbi:Gfo/Idh/MocA family oxidoreductase [bacterium]|nr:Gfo/Idh/MocA family oxidoreductase [bacterium]RQV95251.1 MAG: gfo/Idh/MocA family oxidoreductase [bacterium]